MKNVELFCITKSMAHVVGDTRLIAVNFTSVPPGTNPAGGRVITMQLLVGADEAKAYEVSESIKVSW
jgi:hypothetical protein